MSHGRHRRRRRHGIFNAQAPAQNNAGNDTSQSQSSQSQQSQEGDQSGHGGGDS
jgi:hypothetical protein